MKKSTQKSGSETVSSSVETENETPIVAQEPAAESPRDVLSMVLRDGAQKMLRAAIQKEVDDYLLAKSGLVDEAGRKLVVRNGSLPEREVITGLGPVSVRQPRVRDKRPAADREVFVSSILPKYLRKTKSMEELVPWLYLKGISTNDFPEALQSLLGKDIEGFSATTITRLKSVWEEEYDEWSKRSLTDKRYVYIWADGIYSNIRFNENDGRNADENRQCLLVLMGATADGTKELLAVVAGVRESDMGWKELLLNLKARGLRHDPLLAIGDGALGFWKALDQVFPTTRVQRCTVHKTANVLDKLPKSVQPQAKRMLHSIWDAPTKEEANNAFDLFINTFEAKHSSAVECLRKDRDVLLTFYDFPAENWCHIRTTNPIESTFATIRLRHRKTKNNGSAKASLVMIFKLAQSAEKGWRKLRGHQHIPELIKGIRFIDGINEHSINDRNSTTTKTPTAHTDVVA